MILVVIRQAMGIALLAVSWFYSRFVFGIGPSDKMRDQTPGGLA